MTTDRHSGSPADPLTKLAQLVASGEVTMERLDPLAVPCPSKRCRVAERVPCNEDPSGPTHKARFTAAIKADKWRPFP